MPTGTGMRLANRAQIVGVIPPANYSATASTDIYVSLKECMHATIIIKTGAWAGGTAAVTLLQATIQTGVGNKALTGAMPFMYTNSANAASSTLVATAVVSDTFNLSVAASSYVIEVDASSLDIANGFDYLCVHVATPGSNADYYDATMVLSPVRHAGNTMPNALV